jgi:hypothetical protein
VLPSVEEREKGGEGGVSFKVGDSERDVDCITVEVATLEA